MMLGTVALLLSPAAMPQPCPIGAPWGNYGMSEPGVISRMDNIIRVQGDQASWNHVPVDRPTLTQYTLRAGAMQPRPRLVLDGSAADCAALREIAALIAENSDCTPELCVVATEPAALRKINPPAPPAPPRSSD